MGLDIRVPVGLLFMATGGMMALFGVFTRGSDIYGKSLGVNLNLDWGMLMLAFGAVMYLLGRRKKKAPATVAPRQQSEQSRVGH